MFAEGVQLRACAVNYLDLPSRRGRTFFNCDFRFRYQDPRKGITDAKWLPITSSSPEPLLRRAFANVATSFFFFSLLP